MTQRAMTCELLDENLLDYLEEDLAADRRATLDAHIANCARCTALLRDINAIRADAAQLPAFTASDELWKGIAARIETPVVPMAERGSRSRTLRPAWIAIAASLLVATTAGVTFLITSRSVAQKLAANAPVHAAPTVVAQTENSATRIEEKSEPAENVAATRKQAGQENRARLASNARNVAPTGPEALYSSEINRLQRVLSERKNQLDPNTVMIVESNLKLIDSAIKRSKAALMKDPASGFLTDQLTKALDKKVELLRTAALMPSST